jgi:nicotinamide-nucleotide amidase
MMKTIAIEPIEIDVRLVALAAELLQICRENGELLATAESCTGGLVAAALTAIPGSSDVFERGFVTYSNAAKSEMLGVPFWLIERHGAVSEDVARAMAGGALTHSQASLAVAVTGIAGPDGGTAEKPVGLVHFAAGRRDQPIVHERVVFGELGRAEIRRRSVERALALVRTLMRGDS